MEKIKIKPISVNKCWCGKRFKTPDYKVYEEELLYTLPKDVFTKTLKKCGEKTKNKEIQLIVFLEFGFSNKASDIDNPVKPFLDILQKKYKFDDKNIYKLSVEKKIVKRGDEYIKFALANIFV